MLKNLAKMTSVNQIKYCQTRTDRTKISKKKNFKSILYESNSYVNM